MADIYHNFTINATPGKIFEAISRSKGLDNWWTKSSDVNPEPGGVYNLSFGPLYQWKAVVSKYTTDKVFELEITEADSDWLGTRVGFSLNDKGGITELCFYHTGWPQLNDHYKISSFCWAMYLRILKRFVEFGERVSYDDRLNQ
jgi:uncharacterized protein YndB with AHSA1/START domain